MADPQINTPGRLDPDANLDDVVMVSTTRVVCDGGGTVLGHPRTWLDMGTDTTVTCKYCDRVFVLDPNAAPGAH